MAGQAEIEISVLLRAIADLRAAVDGEIAGAIERLRRGRPALPRAVPPESESESESGVGSRSETGARDRLDVLMRRLEDRMRDAGDRKEV